MESRRFEGRGHDLALHRALHVGDFFRAFVDQQDDQEDFRVVALDRLGDVLQHHRLADARRGHDQAALPLAERGDDVDDPTRAILQRRILDLHVEPLFGIERRQVVEQDLGLDHLRIFEVDRVDLEQGEVTLALTRAANGAVHRVARAQAEAADLRRRDIDVVRTRQVVGVGAAQEAEAVRQDLQHARGDDLDLFIGQSLQDGEQQVLLAQVAGVLDVQALGEGDQVFRRLLVQFLKRDAAVGDDGLAVVVLIIILGRGVDAMIVVLRDRLNRDFGLGLLDRRRRAAAAQAQGATRPLNRRFRCIFSDFGVRSLRRIGHNGVLVRAPGRGEAARSRKVVMASAAGAGREGDGFPAGSNRQASQKRGTALHGSAARFTAAEPRKTPAGQGPSGSARRRRSRQGA